jgi:hypothetical protein
MIKHANGRFDIEMTSLPATAGVIAGFSISKRFHGDLMGSSTGHMLAVRTTTPGSAGYVLMEVVTATLHGRQGSFVRQHSGTLTRGQPELSVTVIPDSATGDLTGLTGRMTIDAANDHRYVFSYELPGPA